MPSSTVRPAAGSVSVTRAGDATFADTRSPTRAHSTWIVPRGVGTLPFAQARSATCGCPAPVASPGLAGATPSTSSVRAGAAPLDQPWSHDGPEGSTGPPPNGPIISHIVVFG